MLAGGTNGAAEYEDRVLRLLLRGGRRHDRWGACRCRCGCRRPARRTGVVRAGGIRTFDREGQEAGLRSYTVLSKAGRTGKAASSRPKGYRRDHSGGKPGELCQRQRDTRLWLQLLRRSGFSSWISTTPPQNLSGDGWSRRCYRGSAGSSTCRLGWGRADQLGGTGGVAPGSTQREDKLDLTGVPRDVLSNLTS